jgi:hypothetical protein
VFFYFEISDSIFKLNPLMCSWGAEFMIGVRKPFLSLWFLTILIHLQILGFMCGDPRE